MLKFKCIKNGSGLFSRRLTNSEASTFAKVCGGSLQLVLARVLLGKVQPVLANVVCGGLKPASQDSCCRDAGYFSATLPYWL